VTVIRHFFRLFFDFYSPMFIIFGGDLGEVDEKMAEWKRETMTNDQLNCFRRLISQTSSTSIEVLWARKITRSSSFSRGETMGIHAPMVFR
jgi:hypothetical protein